MEDRWKIGFWNVAGLANKEKEFWEGIKEWEVVVMIETWVEEKNWEKWKIKLPKGYKWTMQGAKKKNKKGRAMGGMMMGIRDEMAMEGDERQDQEEGIMSRKVKAEKDEWVIVATYVNGDIDKKLESLRRWMERQSEEERVIIGGDFNARTGLEGGRVRDMEDEESGRRSKDKKVNAEGKKLTQMLGELGWEIFNGNIEGDEEGEFTYTGGRGETVIDYVLGDERTRRGIERMEVADRVESDHHPLVITMKKGRKRKKGKAKEDKRTKMGRWSEEMKREFERRMRGVRLEEDGEESEKQIGERIKKEIERSEEVGGRKRKRNMRGWWDEECREKKGEVRKELRCWRKGSGTKEKYREKKREYHEMIERKKREEQEEMVREISEANTENKVWEIINRDRKKRKTMGEGIEAEEWKSYFMSLIGGEEERLRMGTEGTRREGDETEISKEEIRLVIRNLKEGKAVGIDGIPNEAWRYGGEQGIEVAWGICRKVWRGGGWPEGWKEGVIAPIVKKGAGTKVEEYRGVTLMPSLYKIYTAVLAKRLEEEAEEKGMIPPNQTGFRRGVGTIDNVYVLNYVVNREVAEERGKLVALFIDLKAAFDSVDRKIMMDALEERGVREGLRERVGEVYEETMSRVKAAGVMGDKFWTGKGVRQGCPMSPILFNLLTADIEEELGKGSWGGVKVKGRRICSLAYADDVVVMAKNEEEMQSMIRRLEKYFERKKLEVNVGKTKVMRFRKGGGRNTTVDWRWRGKKIEEVKEFKYLGYVFKKNGGQEAHIKDRIKKAAAVMKEAWGIGRRKFEKIWERKMWLFDTLVWTVMGYGAEVWGWKERQEMERMQERYLKWTLGVEWQTPGYMVREETKRDKIMIRAGKRAWNYEEKLASGKGSEIARECLEEIKERQRDGRGRRSRWEEEREEMKEREGREDSLNGYEGLEMESRKEQEKERRELIKESRYNKWYKEVMTEGIPKYLTEGWKTERTRRIARVRLGNEVRERWYWRREEERVCRVCEGEQESWEHLIERCRSGGDEGKSIGDKMREIMDETGRGEEWIKELEKVRKDKERDNGQEEGE